MKWLKKFLGLKDNSVKDENMPASEQGEEEKYKSSNSSNAHHVVLEYIRAGWNGLDQDPQFKHLSLSKDLNFNLLNLAELILAVCAEKKYSIVRAIDFTTIYAIGSGELTTLLTRVNILSQNNLMTEDLRFLVLDSGLVGDAKEIKPVVPPDNDPVAVVLAFISVMEESMLDTDHDGIDNEFGYV